MYDGCCSVSKVTIKKVARKSRQKIEGEGDDDRTTTKKEKRSPENWGPTVVGRGAHLG